MKTQFAAVLAFVALLAVAPAFAEDAKPADGAAATPAAEAAVAPAEAPAEAPAAPDFAKLDANADGSLSKEELAEGFDAKDADKDGKVTKEEFEAPAAEAPKTEEAPKAEEGKKE